jgi:hypothetical protein
MLLDRQSTVRSPWRSSFASPLGQFGVSQGPVLGSILFLLSTVDLPNGIEARGLQPHIYADDAQIYGDSSSLAAHELRQHLSACVDDVTQLMRSNGLQLNASKTEILC